MRKMVLTLVVVFFALPAFALPVSDVFFFGDSLTDTGNFTQVYSTLPHPPGAPAAIPGPPYDPQGRFTNGPIVYADVLAAGLGSNALAWQRGGHNFAFGGARTRYDVGGPQFPGIIDQVAAFRALPGPADQGALYVLWAGSNNLQDILLGRTVDVLGNPIPGVGGTLGDIAAMITGLYTEGARNFLLPNVANLGRVPLVIEQGLAAQGAATGLSQLYNASFTQLINTLHLQLPDARLITFDAFSAIEDLIVHANQLGITDTTSRCYTGDDQSFTGGGSVCLFPDKNFFFDGRHPTSIVHSLIGQEMLAVVLAVSEPPQLALVAVVAVLLWFTMTGRARKSSHS